MREILAINYAYSKCNIANSALPVTALVNDGKYNR